MHLNDLRIGDIRAIDGNHLRAITFDEERTARIIVRGYGHDSFDVLEDVIA